MNDNITGRFAPTPSGEMHIGNIYCALIAWLSAKSRGGRVLLRIEDLDTARCAGPDAAKRLIDDLDFLGLGFDGGYDESSYQSHRSDIYKAVLEKISEKATVYPCYCSRAELHAASAPHSSDGRTVYDGRCFRLFLSGEKINGKKAPSLRLHMPDTDITFCDGLMGAYSDNLAHGCGDIILRRSDGVFAYNLAVVADDALSGVTEVVRGRDLVGVTPAQIYIYRLLGYDVPRYCHIPLMLDENGRRLSKRDGDLCLSEYRRSHASPDALIGYIAWLAGLIPEPSPMSARSLIPYFSFDRLPRGDILFNFNKIRLDKL